VRGAAADDEDVVEGGDDGTAASAGAANGTGDCGETGSVAPRRS
jgi:hypothetical protein